jgi:hypothetical protein
MVVLGVMLLWLLIGLVVGIMLGKMIKYGMGGVDTDPDQR